MAAKAELNRRTFFTSGRGAWKDLVKRLLPADEPVSVVVRKRKGPTDNSRL
ncbi:MAG: hypothetical protein Q7S79_02415 [bacterium]|nr:hypothetical protein [bacterium]